MGREKLTRRDFLKIFGVTAAGAFVDPGGFASLAISPGRIREHGLRVEDGRLSEIQAYEKPSLMLDQYCAEIRAMWREQGSLAQVEVEFLNLFSLDPPDKSRLEESLHNRSVLDRVFEGGTGLMIHSGLERAKKLGVDQTFTFLDQWKAIGQMQKREVFNDRGWTFLELPQKLLGIIHAYEEVVVFSSYEEQKAYYVLQRQNDQLPQLDRIVGGYKALPTFLSFMRANLPASLSQVEQFTWLNDYGITGTYQNGNVALNSGLLSPFSSNLNLRRMATNSKLLAVIHEINHSVDPQSLSQSAAAKYHLRDLFEYVEEYLSMLENFYSGIDRFDNIQLRQIFRNTFLSSNSFGINSLAEEGWISVRYHPRDVVNAFSELHHILHADENNLLSVIGMEKVFPVNFPRGSESNWLFYYFVALRRLVEKGLTNERWSELYGYLDREWVQPILFHIMTGPLAIVWGGDMTAQEKIERAKKQMQVNRVSQEISDWIIGLIFEPVASAEDKRLVMMGADQTGLVQAGDTVLGLPLKRLTNRLKTLT